MVRFFLVDDHAAVRRGLVDLLGDDPELRFVGEAGSVAEAMAKIPAAGPDVAVLDDRLPDGNGIELCRDLLSAMPDLRCMILATYASDAALLYAILAGGSGYVVKQVRGMELACAIKQVGAGRSLIDRREADAALGKLRRLGDGRDGRLGLSDRDRTLLDLLGAGLTNKQIAEKMLVPEDSVKTYVSRLLVRLGIARRLSRG
ncbi:response regulator transcription factor [Mycobacterium palustre]|uniref:LuxR family transcriptional regulator n=1 Tax=Mycobacterium palustre TaxID=153971 RepID=A0A1X1ZVZ1_9MYCO|nr:response regulator transcription factor [Mycobacterium palustre]MCV7103915.1 response regulator transcription factor [Mycobacterium palustre]ORW27898.1 LuxR family transcriptional regulator [Mycobacterium palustre]